MGNAIYSSIRRSNKGNHFCHPTSNTPWSHFALLISTCIQRIEPPIHPLPALQKTIRCPLRCHGRRRRLRQVRPKFSNINRLRNLIIIQMYHDRRSSSQRARHWRKRWDFWYGWDSSTTFHMRKRKINGRTTHLKCLSSRRSPRSILWQRSSRMSVITVIHRSVKLGIVTIIHLPI